jgi:hypothetical protein
MAVRTAGVRLAGAHRVAAIAAAAGAAGALAAYASDAVFALTHVVCYSAGMCGRLSLPERIMYVWGATSHESAGAALLVVPLVVACALATRRPHSALI